MRKQCHSCGSMVGNGHLCPRINLVDQYHFTHRYKDGQPDSWMASHEDYDGPEDPRCFAGPTKGDVIDQINEYHEEGER